MTHHATRQLAEFVVSTSLSHMPDEVVDRAKYFVLDYLGVALRGSLVDSSATVRAFVDRFAPPGHATIIGIVKLMENRSQTPSPRGKLRGRE
jgi:2-methylcitrate dehydratase PrpD